MQWYSKQKQQEGKTREKNRIEEGGGEVLVMVEVMVVVGGMEEKGEMRWREETEVEGNSIIISS